MRATPQRLTFIPFQMPRLTDRAPRGTGWIHEAKHDGYRTQIILQGGQARAFTRRCNDWTDRYGVLIEAVKALAASETPAPPRGEAGY